MKKPDSNIVSAALVLIGLAGILAGYWLDGNSLAGTFLGIVVVYGVAWSVLYAVKQKYNADWIDIKGPLIFLRTSSTRIFDKLAKYGRFWRVYASLGVALVVTMGVLMAYILLTVFGNVATNPPSPTGVFAPQNILLIPGVNDYVPASIAVIIGLLVAVLIHEFGHGVMSRVEGIKVNYTGVIFAVIPIGAFVDPDEATLRTADSGVKKRVFGIGIMNNVVVGLAAVLLLMALMSFASVSSVPYVYGLAQNGPANLAGIQPGFMIETVNGNHITSYNEIASALAPSGTSTIEGIDKNGIRQTYTVTPVNGKIGVYFYASALSMVQSPVGPLLLLTAPLDILGGGNGGLSVFAFDNTDTQFYTVPAIPFFWQIVHILFWIFWINVAVGMTNAIPMVPMDGGLLAKEYVVPIAKRIPILRRRPEAVMTLISVVLLTLLVGIIMIPQIFG